MRWQVDWLKCAEGALRWDVVPAATVRRCATPFTAVTCVCGGKGARSRKVNLQYLKYVNKYTLLGVLRLTKRNGKCILKRSDVYLQYTQQKHVFSGQTKFCL